VSRTTSGRSPPPENGRAEKQFSLKGRQKSAACRHLIGINADNTVCQAGRDRSTKKIVINGKKTFPLSKLCVDQCYFSAGGYYYLSADFPIAFMLAKIGPFTSQRQTHATIREEVAFRMAMK